MPKAEPAPATRRPRLIVALGRGRTGKKVFLSWMLHTAARDIPLIAIDADARDEKGLSKRYPEALRPTGINDDRRVWLEQKLGHQMETAQADDRHDILLHVGGGDYLMRKWGSEMNMVAWAEESGVDVVAVHLIGPDVSDLADLESLEAKGVFAPTRTILLFNRGLISPDRDPMIAFNDVIKSEVVKKVLERKGKWAFMPHLACMAALENVSFSDAIGPTSPLHFWDRRRVGYWLERDMAEMRAKMDGWIG